MKRIALKINDNDQNMIIPIRGVNNLLGYDDDIASMLSTETDDSINETSDSETRRLLPILNYTITFSFYKTSSSSYVTNVAPDEFVPADYKSEGVQNSFYVIQLFDTYKDEIQSKKHTGYFNGFDFANPSLSSVYTNNKDYEFFNLYVSQDVLDSIPSTGGTFYVKFLFYSAKSGKFYSFLNNNNLSLNTQEKLYHKILIFPETLKYQFVNYSAIQLKELTNAAYNTFVNNTVDSVAVQYPNYPTGTTFDNTGNYVNS